MVGEKIIELKPKKRERKREREKEIKERRKKGGEVGREGGRHGGASAFSENSVFISPSVVWGF